MMWSSYIIIYDNSFVEPNAKTNVVIAAFTTAYARLKLYNVLDLLQECVLYYDTDSVIFILRPGESEPSTGNYLGDLTNELKQGDYITTFISGGPKNYCYKTASNKIETKVRGITLNCTALKNMNFGCYAHPMVVSVLIFSLKLPEINTPRTYLPNGKKGLSDCL